MPKISTRHYTKIYCLERGGRQLPSLGLERYPRCQNDLILSSNRHVLRRHGRNFVEAEISMRGEGRTVHEKFPFGKVSKF